MTKTLPKELTSYDFLKTFAVVSMIIDHVGFYFYPEENWFRTIGRLCVPCWFFLIGYAQSRDLGPRMWIGAAVLICSDLIAGLYLFPFNILATMIIVRAVLDDVMERALRTTSTFWAINAVLFFLIIPSGMLGEYGTQGLILAMFGWIVRNREEMEARGKKELAGQYFAFAAGSFIFMQTILFGLDNQQRMVLMLGTVAVMGVLYFFKSMTFPKLSAAMPRPFTWLIQLTGRRTLEIYVGHLLLFKAICLVTQPERFVLLDWSLFFTGFDS